MKPLLVALGLLAMAGPVAANEASSDTVVPEMTKAEKKLVHLVQDYVRDKRGWMDGLYEVVLTGHEGDLVVFTVYLTADDAHHLVTADGAQSFQVLVDPATKKVAAERFF